MSSGSRRSGPRSEESLSEYRRKRSFGETPEPDGVGGSGAKGASSGRFVVQQHDATSLHWDLRLERGGALASWALPRGIPLDPGDDRLAVHTEDHPLEYLDFAGTIPAGQYGAGEMTIWDRGTYVAEKFEDAKVVATFAGERLRGRYALFRIRKAGERTDGWLIHRMDPPPPGREPMPEPLEPMLAKRGKLPADEEGWAFEVRWSGRRVLAFARPGDLVLRDPEGAEVQALFPEVRRAGRALGATEAILDGVLVAFDADGVPDRDRLAHRLEDASDSTVRRRARSTPVALVVFDLPFLDGTVLCEDAYEDRRERLAEVPIDGEVWQAPAHHVGDGAALLEAGRRRGLGGVVAKRLGSPYEPGKRSANWREIGAGRR
ncbi:MAG TPA: DNA polymerase ligase N-terminal domain-containing protein [Solirubrobacterales bacterium]